MQAPLPTDLSSAFIIIIYYLCLSVCLSSVCVHVRVHVYAMVSMWRSETTLRSQFSSDNWTHIVRLVWQMPLPAEHPTSPALPLNMDLPVRCLG